MKNLTYILNGLAASLIFLLIPAAMVRSADSIAKDANLISNPGFETVDSARPGIPGDWILIKRNVAEGCGVSLVDDVVHSGKRAVKLEVLKSSVSAEASRSTDGALVVSRYAFPAPPAQSTIQVSVWMKGQDVKRGRDGWYKLGCTMNGLDASGAGKHHWDVGLVEGTFDWKKFERKIIVPEGVTSLSLIVAMRACTGTAWVDDIEVKVVEQPLNQSAVFQKAMAVNGPVVIPRPWKAVYGKGQIILGSKLTLSVPEGKGIFKNALISWLKAEDISYRTSSSDGEKATDEGLLFVSDDSARVISERLSASYPGVKLKDMGADGYFLSITQADGKPVICIGANTEQGSFYALQTLKQLVSKADGRLLLAEASILDKPAFAMRGIAFGPQWFDKSEIAIERLAGLKCNYMWGHAVFWDGIFCQNNWRQPLRDGHKKRLAEYLEMCRNNFISPVVSIAPRGNPHTQYSSDTDIDLVVAKMNDLYGIGFREFGINFDDLQNYEQERLRVPADIEKFGNNIGKAHFYFVNEIYKRLKQKHSDAKLSIIPLVYSGFTTLPEEGGDFNKDYLRQLANLPADIEFISCPYGMDNIREVARLTKRTPLVWDNFFASWGDRGVAPVFLPPFRWTKDLKSADIKGYIFLPCIPVREDAAGTSWLTAADYIWNGDRQSQDASYQAAVVRAVGGADNLGPLKEYTDLSARLNIGNYAVPGKTREERLSYVQKSITELQQWQNKLIPVLPKSLSAALNKEISTYLENFALLENDMSAKAFPVKANRVSGVIKIDGVLDDTAWKEADSVTNLKQVRGGKPAQQQTTFKFLHDGKNLYVGAVCQEPHPESIVAIRKQRGSSVFMDDCVELFLSPQSDNDYYHIAVNTLGAVYDKYTADLKWHGSCNAAARVEKDTWTAEMAIPLKQLGVSSISSGSRWTFNACRERYAEKPAEPSSYALVFKGRFQTPSRFEVLEFQ